MPDPDTAAEKAILDAISTMDVTGLSNKPRANNYVGRVLQAMRHPLLAAFSTKDIDAAIARLTVTKDLAALKATATDNPQAEAAVGVLDGVFG